LVARHRQLRAFCFLWLLPQAKWLRLWLAIRFAPRFFAVKEMGQGSFDKTKTTDNIYYLH